MHTANLLCHYSWTIIKSDPVLCHCYLCELMQLQTPLTPPLGVTASYLSRLISFRQKKLFTLLRLYIELSSGFNINKTWAKTNSIH